MCVFVHCFIEDPETAESNWDNHLLYVQSQLQPGFEQCILLHGAFPLELKFTLKYETSKNLS